MGNPPYIADEILDSDDSGVIQLGVDSAGKLQVTPTETISLKTKREQSTLELLESIDKSLKTLLIYMQEITGDKLEN